jgi:hypothetical protein
VDFIWQVWGDIAGKDRGGDQGHHQHSPKEKPILHDKPAQPRGGFRRWFIGEAGCMPSQATFTGSFDAVHQGTNHRVRSHHDHQKGLDFWVVTSHEGLDPKIAEARYGKDLFREHDAPEQQGAILQQHDEAVPESLHE